MKKLITVIVITLSFLSCKAQQFVEVNLSTIDYNDDLTGKYYKDIDGNFNPFIGVWENTTGSTTFRIELFKEAITTSDYSTDTIQGKYYLIENAGTLNETIMCTGENMVKEGYVIVAKSLDGLTMSGAIYDTCVPDELNSTFGILKMDITGTNTAHWTITRKGMKLVGMEYVIPIDIILTKQ